MASSSKNDQEMAGTSPAAAAARASIGSRGMKRKTLSNAEILDAKRKKEKQFPRPEVPVSQEDCDNIAREQYYEGLAAQRGQKVLCYQHEPVQCWYEAVVLDYAINKWTGRVMYYVHYYSYPISHNEWVTQYRLRMDTPDSAGQLEAQNVVLRELAKRKRKAQKLEARKPKADDNN